MTVPSYVLTVQGIGSTGEVTINIVERLGARRAGLTLDGYERRWSRRPVASGAHYTEYPSLYAAMAAAADVIREERWPCFVRVKLFEDGVGPDRESIRSDALTRGREVIKSLDAGAEEDAGVVAQVIEDLIARVEAAEARRPR